MIISPYSRQKPARGSFLNREHPLARDLVYALPVNENTGDMCWDHAGGNITYHSVKAGGNNPRWVADGLEYFENYQNLIGPNGSVLGAGAKTFVINWTYTNDTTGYIYFFILDDDANEFSVYVGHGLGTLNDLYMWYNSTTGNFSGITDWEDHYHTSMAFVFEPGGTTTRDAYKNGVLEITNSTAITHDAAGFADHSIRIGRPGTVKRHLGGILHYCYIYNRRLTADELLWLHREPYSMFLPLNRTPHFIPSALGDIELNISQNIAVIESTDLNLPLAGISVSDGIGTNENIGPDVPLADIIGIDNLTVTEILNLLKDIVPSAFENIGITEFIQILQTLPGLNVSENVGLLENIQAVMADLEISASDNIAVIEFITAAIEIILSQQEDIGLVESIAIILDLLKSATEQIGVSENIVMQLEGLLEDISQQEIIAIIENIQLSITMGDIVATDNIAVSEFITSATEILSSVFENLSVTENLSLLLELVTSISDSIGIDENIVVAIQGLLGDISQQEIIAIIENIQLSITLGEIIPSESMAVSEFITAAMQLLTSVDETIAVIENLSVLLKIVLSISEQIAVAENIAVEIEGLLGTISQTDIIAIIENIQSSMDLGQIVVSDNLAVSEFINTALELSLSTFENLSLAENLSVILAITTSVFEQIALIENINVVLEAVIGAISISDNLAIIENIQAQLDGASFSTSDSIGIFEAITALLPLSLTIADVIAITEYILVNVNIGANVIDTITLTENIAIQFDNLLFEKIENITISEFIQIIVSGIVGKVKSDFSFKRPGATFTITRPGANFTLQ